MLPLTHQSRSMSGSEAGSSLSRQPMWQLLILYNVGLELSAEVQLQNRLIPSTTASYVGNDEMRDIKNMAVSLKDLITKLKVDAANAQAGFLAEGNRAHENTQKVRSATADLKEANLMVEEMLGETGSNFPPLESSETSGVGHADANGVTLNPEFKK